MTGASSSFRAIIKGRVQGVGFRYHARSVAQSLGVSGHVRNLPDGSVEVLAVGQSASLSALIEELQRGPSSGRVTECLVEWNTAPDHFSGFTVKY